MARPGLQPRSEFWPRVLNTFNNGIGSSGVVANGMMMVGKLIQQGVYYPVYGNLTETEIRTIAAEYDRTVSTTGESLELGDGAFDSTREVMARMAAKCGPQTRRECGELLRWSCDVISCMEASEAADKYFRCLTDAECIAEAEDGSCCGHHRSMAGLRDRITESWDNRSFGLASADENLSLRAVFTSGSIYHLPMLCEHINAWKGCVEHLSSRKAGEGSVEGCICADGMDNARRWFSDWSSAVL